MTTAAKQKTKNKRKKAIIFQTQIIGEWLRIFIYICGNEDRKKKKKKNDKMQTIWHSFPIEMHEVMMIMKMMKQQ